LGVPRKRRVGLSAVARYFAAIPNAEKRCAIFASAGSGCYFASARFICGLKKFKLGIDFILILVLTIWETEKYSLRIAYYDKN